MSDTTSRLELAYSKLGLREPFIAAVMTKLAREVGDKVGERAIPTAATNGHLVVYNPDFVAKQNDEELFGLVLHESLHVILMHMWNRGDRDPMLWVIANDAIINRMIKERSYQLPAGGVHIAWVTDAMTSEEVYERLRQEQGKGGKPQSGAGFDSDGDGDLIDAPSEERRADMQATIMASAQMAKACGQGSALIDRILGDLKPPKVRWQDALRNMLTESARADYTYARFSRRFIASGLYMPSLHTPAMGGLMIGFDTSGSLFNQEACDRIASEIQSIADDLSPEFIEVAYCDTQVVKIERFERDDRLKLNPKGGGGTRFAPVFEHAAASGEHYVGLVFFTDMEGNLTECVEPEYPTLWANVGAGQYKQPFGDLVQVDL